MEKSFSSYLRIKIILFGACLKYLLPPCSDGSENAEIIFSSYSTHSLFRKKWRKKWRIDLVDEK